MNAPAIEHESRLRAAVVMASLLARLPAPERVMAAAWLDEIADEIIDKIAASIEVERRSAN